ncbi:MAG: hypothetical protein ABUR63_08750, partial [Verrucomicrobiota bacterium]
MILPPIMREGPYGGPLPSPVRAMIRALADPREASGPVLQLDDQMADLATAEGLGALLGSRVAAGHIGVSWTRRE